jgi:general stress protein YciG
MKQRVRASLCSASDGEYTIPPKRSKPALAQCKATTSSGARCKARPNKDGLCFFHSDPKRAAELGRKGGRRNRHTYESPLQPVAAPESAGDVKRMLAETMADTRAGKIDPKLGSTLGYLGMSLLRAFELADFEPRLKQLEQRNELEELEEQEPTSVNLICRESPGCSVRLPQKLRNIRV